MIFEKALRKLRISAVTQTDPRADTLATWNYTFSPLDSEKPRNFRNGHVSTELLDVRAKATMLIYTLYLMYTIIYTSSKSDLHGQGAGHAR